MVQVIPVIHDSYVIFSQTNNDRFCSNEFCARSKAVWMVLWEKFLNQVHLRPFTPTDAENGSHYPHEPALLPEVHAQWPRVMWVINFRQMPRLQGQGVARCSSYLQLATPGNQRAGEELESLLGVITWHTLHFYCLPWDQWHYPEMWQTLDET